ncbi:MAG: ANTAR domain-containing protein [Gaiellaceae bacterium]
MTEERVYEHEGNGHVQPAIAARQVLSRIVNERILQLSDGAGARTAGVAVVCECGNDGCFERIELTKAEYHAILARATRFVLLPGHEIPEHERVVERRDGYVVAERAAPSATRSRARRPTHGARPSAPAPPSADGLLADLEDAKMRIEQLEFALQSRIAIEQAKGVLAERFGWSVDTAFEVLRSAARSARMNIHQLARDVVPGEPMPQPITAALARGAGRRAADAGRT